MKLEAGMYVRYKPLLSSKYVKINKIKEIEEKENCLHIWLEDKDLITEKYLIKASYNIIDLIEVGDYVNGKKVIDTFTDYIFDYSEEFKVIRFSETDILHDVKHIKLIVTHEQMEQMAYKVRE